MVERNRTVDRFILLYALAWAGGTIAYVPLLSVLLPVRVETLAGKIAGVDWLAYVALTGAIAASAGGVLFGWLSDITRNRRGWILAGLVLSCVLLLHIGRANSLTELIIAIIGWQLALNMMLGPLAAWGADIVPDGRKGMLGGFMAFAPGFGAISGALVTLPGLADQQMRLVLVAVLVALCVAPVLLFGARDATKPDIANVAMPRPDRPAQSLLLRMWFARLAIQVAEATLLTYLYFWLSGLHSGVTDNQTARLFSIIMLISAPTAILAGRWSDQTDRPIAPLRAGALLAAAGLVAMALASDPLPAMMAYGLFGVAGGVFLALHSAQTLRILPRADRRGRDLGLFNLANTLPSLVMPWLVIALVPRFGYSALFVLLAVLAAVVGLLLRDPQPNQ